MPPLIVNDPGYSRLERKLIDFAFAEIHRCSSGKSRHISFLLKRSKIISWGWNEENKSHPLAQRFGYFNGAIHSELMAVVKFNKFANDISDCTLVNIRIDRHNQIRNSRPCLRCQNLLIGFNITDVVYTNGNGIFQYL